MRQGATPRLTCCGVACLREENIMQPSSWPPEHLSRHCPHAATHECAECRCQEWYSQPPHDVRDFLTDMRTAWLMEELFVHGMVHE
jgi:hypothetical protein